jgi:hypothetical protein
MTRTTLVVRGVFVVTGGRTGRGPSSAWHRYIAAGHTTLTVMP